MWSGVGDQNRLTITIPFMHVFWGNANDSTLFNDLCILSADALNDLQVFHGDLEDVCQYV